MLGIGRQTLRLLLGPVGWKEWQGEAKTTALFIDQRPQVPMKKSVGSELVQIKMQPEPVRGQLVYLISSQPSSVRSEWFQFWQNQHDSFIELFDQYFVSKPVNTV